MDQLTGQEKEQGWYKQTSFFQTNGFMWDFVFVLPRIAFQQSPAGGLSGHDIVQILQVNPRARIGNPSTPDTDSSNLNFEK